MKTLLEFSHVSFAYKSEDFVLKDINFSIRENEKVALLGLNGAGKSTLILHTNGLLLPVKGIVTVDGLSTSSGDIKEIRKKVGLVFQNPDDQLFMTSVWEDVAFGPRNMGLDEKEVKDRVEQALSMTATRHLAEKFPMDLSGGQKKAVSIATVLSMSPKILVMDEPTSGLDYKATANLVSLLNSLTHSMLISSHDIDFVRAVCPRSIVVENGEIIYDGDTRYLEYPPLKS